MKNILLLVILSILQSCSSNDDGSTDNQDQNQVPINKSIESIFPSDNEIQVLTESDLITRYYSRATTFNHHVKYNSNSRVESIFLQGSGGPSAPFGGFNYDYINGNSNPPEVIFGYTGNNLTSINSDQLGNFTFTYDSEDRIIEIKETPYRQFKHQFIYDTSQNPIAVIESSFDGNNAQRWELTYDDKINPFYESWNNNSFPYFLSFNGLAVINYGFFQNNLIKKEQLATNEILNISYNYDSDNHPSSYSYIDNQNRTRTGTMNYN